MSGKVKNTQLDGGNNGLVVERRIDKKSSKRQGRESVRPKREPHLISFEYTKKARAFSERFGKSVFFVYGKNGVRVLGALSKVCKVSDVGISGEGVRFEVPSKHRKQIIAILNNLCYDYKIIKNRGALPKAVNAAARLGFAAGMILVLTAVVIFPQFVTRVNIRVADGAYGDTIDNALNTRILGILSSQGVQRGKWLPSLDLGDIEKSILALDGVSYASVQRNGTHIEVQIKQEQRKDYLVEVYGSKVLSQKVAVVTRVIVEGGTAVVDYGDVVRAGDTLIGGYVLFGEDKLEVEAKGIVYGKVYHKKTVFFADNFISREVGKVKRVTRLSMFGKVPKAPSSPFEKYELSTAVNDLGFMLPFKIYSYEFREIVETESPNELSLDEMYSQVYSQIIAEFKEPSRVLEVYKTVSEAEGGKYVTVTVEAEERIS